jgi:beta-barrel assembly-enhancing protease
MQDIKSAPKTCFLYRTLAIQLILGMACSGLPAYAATPAGDVSVEGNSAAIQNIGRAMQSPDARPANAPTRNSMQSQPTIVLPDMGDPGGDTLSRVDERKDHAPDTSGP